MAESLKQIQEFRFFSLDHQQYSPLYTLCQNFDIEYLKSLNPKSLVVFEYSNRETDSKSKLMEEVLRISKDISPVITSFHVNLIFQVDSQSILKILENLASRCTPGVLKRLGFGHQYGSCSNINLFFEKLEKINQVEKLYDVHELVLNNLEFSNESNHRILIEIFINHHLSNFKYLTRLDLIKFKIDAHGDLFEQYLMESNIEKLKFDYSSITQSILTSITKMRNLETFKFTNSSGPYIYNHLSFELYKILFQNEFYSPLKKLKLTGLSYYQSLESKYINKVPIAAELIHFIVDIDLIFIKDYKFMVGLLMIYPLLETLSIRGQLKNVNFSIETEFNLFFQNIFNHKCLRELEFMAIEMNDSLLDQIFKNPLKGKSNLRVIQLRYSSALVNYLRLKTSISWDIVDSSNKISCFIS
ncbi:hypothetical protein DLAC_01896 [Tieghemostelium lacteum]|uniref:Uncharacterized protein n=1 Tax=Tieghemostelium lacteum TaxID=361077 RepID=A0A152A6P1_TIELA|nr:hypothetical protein DLAC_01896 [Tieghemostelium lacteum]|eukprot:KYR01874.1 hypothetical protein DLAC_01896 [Tieghemostelium lacteum]